MKTKISALQLYLMLFLSRVIVSITINVQTVGSSNLIESIFSSLGLFLYLTVFSLPLFVLHKSHPEASLLQIAENNCGRGVSVPMSAIYALYFIVMNIFSLSLFLTLLVNTTDPVASRFSIVLVVLGIALYGAIRGYRNHLARLGMHFHAVHARHGDDFSLPSLRTSRRIISCRFSMTA